VQALSDSEICFGDLCLVGGIGGWFRFIMANSSYAWPLAKAQALFLIKKYMYGPSAI
jgi:hypothetical protein